VGQNRQSGITPSHAAWEGCPSGMAVVRDRSGALSRCRRKARVGGSRADGEWCLAAMTDPSRSTSLFAPLFSSRAIRGAPVAKEGPDADASHYVYSARISSTPRWVLDLPAGIDLFLADLERAIAAFASRTWPGSANCRTSIGAQDRAAFSTSVLPGRFRRLSLTAFSHKQKPTNTFVCSMSFGGNSCR
jgi:hypothetical protein